METDDSLLYVQQLATDPFHVPDESNSRYYITFFDIRFSINLPSITSMISIGSLSFRFPHQNHLWIYLSPPSPMPQTQPTSFSLVWSL